MRKRKLILNIPGIDKAGVLAVRDTEQEIISLIKEREDEWLRILGSNRFYSEYFKTKKDLYNALEILTFEDGPSEEIVNLTVLYLMNKNSDWYLPRIYNRLDSFVKSFDNNQKQTLYYAIKKARNIFLNRKNCFMNKEFRSWIIDDHEFNSTIRRIKYGIS